MTYLQFNSLSTTEQEIICWSRGVEIAAKVDNISMCQLYQVDSFYIEVQYSIPFSIITSIVSFDDTKLLDPYLKCINIDIVL
ncbi:MAG: hypothetical protein ACXWWA_07740 [Chitinophagaceae bacterium]